MSKAELNELVLTSIAEGIWVHFELKRTSVQDLTKLLLL